MSNILMFVNENPEDIDQGFGNYDLYKGFEELGHKVKLISFSDKNLFSSLKDAFLEKIDFAIAFNWVYQNVIRLQTNEGDNVLNKLNIPFVSWLWDGLCVPTNPVLRIPGINHLIVACINEDEVDEIKWLAPHVQQSFFCPLGGAVARNIEGGGVIFLRENIISLILVIVLIIKLIASSQMFQIKFLN